MKAGNRHTLIGAITGFQVIERPPENSSEVADGAASPPAIEKKIVNKLPNEVLKTDELAGCDIKSPGAYPPEFHIDFLGVIGKGCYGVVYEASSKRHGGKCALKVSFGRPQRLEQEIFSHAQVSKGVEQELQAEEKAGKGGPNEKQQKQKQHFRHVAKFYFAATYEASPDEDFAASDEMKQRGSKNAMADQSKKSPNASTAGEEQQELVKPREEGISVVGMELCAPATLHDFVLRNSFTQRADFLYCAKQVLECVATCHKYGVIHRDIKPTNFVFDALFNIRLIDFGLASCDADNIEKGMTDVVAGTPQFMAPEMARNVTAKSREERKPVGVAGDVWSCGIVLFCLLTRRSPFPPVKGADGVPQKRTTMQMVEHVANPRLKVHWPTATELDNARDLQSPLASTTTVPNAADFKSPTSQDSDAITKRKYEQNLAKGVTLSPLNTDLVNALLKVEAHMRPSLSIVLKAERHWRLGKSSSLEAVPAVVKNFLPEPAEPLEEPHKASPSSAPTSPAQADDTKPISAAASPARPLGTSSRSLSKQEEKELEGGTAVDLPGEGGTVKKEDAATAAAAPAADAQDVEEDAVPQPASTHSPSSDEVKIGDDATRASPLLHEPGTTPAGGKNNKKTARASGRASGGAAANPAKSQQQAVMKQERESRVALQRLLQAELHALHGYIRLEEQQDVDWYMLTWTEGNQRRYLDHREHHNFNQMYQVPADGISCDGCGEEIWPGLKCTYFHCKAEKCGMDLCVACSTSYQLSCMCECGKVLSSLSKLEAHKKAASCKRPSGRKSAATKAPPIPAKKRGSGKAAPDTETPKTVESKRGKRNRGDKAEDDDDDAESDEEVKIHRTSGKGRTSGGKAATTKAPRVSGGKGSAKAPAAPKAPKGGRKAPSTAQGIPDPAEPVRPQSQFGAGHEEKGLLSVEDEDEDDIPLPAGRKAKWSPFDQFQQGGAGGGAKPGAPPPPPVEEVLLIGGDEGYGAASQKPNSKNTRQQQDKQKQQQQQPPPNAELGRQMEYHLQQYNQLRAQSMQQQDLSSEDAQQRGVSQQAHSLQPSGPPPAPLYQPPPTAGGGGGSGVGMTTPQRHHAMGTPMPPTAEEKAAIFEGPWIRYFHYAYPHSVARSETGEGEALALCYEIQQGRLGAMFLANGVSDLHSAVYSSFPSNIFLFLVHELDMEEGFDRKEVVQGTQATSQQYPVEVDLLRRVATENTNLLKTNRAPGTMSVCPRKPKTGQSLLNQFGTSQNEEVVYVRWVRGDPDAQLIVFCLSNGCVQVFGPGYELRWMDVERKFIVRTGNTCAVVNDATFDGMRAIEAILNEPIFPDDGFGESDGDRDDEGSSVQSFPYQASRTAGGGGVHPPALSLQEEEEALVALRTQEAKGKKGKKGASPPQRKTATQGRGSGAVSKALPQMGKTEAKRPSGGGRKSGPKKK